MVNINDITKSEIVKTVVLALAVNIFLAYVVNNDLPDSTSMFMALIILVSISYFLGNMFHDDTVLNHFFGGALSYAAYIGILMFFKLTSEPLQIANEITSILIFGGLTAGIFVIQQKFAK